MSALVRWSEGEHVPSFAVPHSSLDTWRLWGLHFARPSISSSVLESGGDGISSEDKSADTSWSKSDFGVRSMRFCLRLVVGRLVSRAALSGSLALSNRLREAAVEVVDVQGGDSVPHAVSGGKGLFPGARASRSPGGAERNKSCLASISSRALDAISAMSVTSLKLSAAISLLLWRRCLRVCATADANCNAEWPRCALTRRSWTSALHCSTCSLNSALRCPRLSPLATAFCNARRSSSSSRRISAASECKSQSLLPRKTESSARSSEHSCSATATLRRSSSASRECASPPTEWAFPSCSSGTARLTDGSLIPSRA